eukprot:RCo003540
MISEKGDAPFGATDVVVLETVPLPVLPSVLPSNERSLPSPEPGTPKTTDQGVGPDPPYDAAYPTYLFQFPAEVRKATEQRRPKWNSLRDPILAPAGEKAEQVQKDTNALLAAMAELRQRTPMSNGYGRSLQATVGSCVSQLSLTPPAMRNIETHLAAMEQTLTMVRGELAKWSRYGPLLNSEASQAAKATLDYFESFTPFAEPKRPETQFSMASYVFDLVQSPAIARYYSSEVSQRDWKILFRILVKMRQLEVTSDLQLVMPWQLRRRQEAKQRENRLLERIEVGAMRGRQVERALDLATEAHLQAYADLHKQSLSSLAAQARRLQRLRGDDVKSGRTLWAILRKKFRSVMKKLSVEDREERRALQLKAFREEVEVGRQQATLEWEGHQQAMATIVAQIEKVKASVATASAAIAEATAVSPSSPKAPSPTKGPNATEGKQQVDTFSAEQSSLTAELTMLRKRSFVLKQKQKERQATIATLQRQIAEARAALQESPRPSSGSGSPSPVKARGSRAGHSASRRIQKELPASPPAGESSSPTKSEDSQLDIRVEGEESSQPE